jgi:hypothetical protein
MNLFAEMFRSKASSADPLSPSHDEGSTFESSILLYRRIMTQSLGGEGKGERGNDLGEVLIENGTGRE